MFFFQPCVKLLLFRRQSWLWAEGDRHEALVGIPCLLTEGDDYGFS